MINKQCFCKLTEIIVIYQQICIYNVYICTRYVFLYKAQARDWPSVTREQCESATWLFLNRVLSCFKKHNY